MRKTKFWIRQYSQIEDVDMFHKVQGYVLEGDYCVCQESMWWTIADAKSGLVVCQGKTLRQVKEAFDDWAKRKYEEWVKTGGDTYKKLCEDMKEFNARALK